MAQYTILNQEEINSIAIEFAIVNIKAYKLLKGGSENTNYLVSTDKAKFVLTICEQKSPTKANELAQLLEHLEKHNFNTSKIIRTKSNKLTFEWNKKPVILKAFLEGDIVQDLPPHLLVLIGKELGKLHKVPPPSYLPKDINYGLTHFNEVELYMPNSPFYPWLKKVKQNVQKYLDQSLPKCLIHSDLFFNNVIVYDKKDSIAVMDFEEASYYFRVFDIGMMIIGICNEGETINLEKANHLLLGYQREIKLLPIEMDALQTFTVYAAAAMSFWRHKNFNYTNPIPAMKDHYIELKNIANYVQDLPKGSFKFDNDENKFLG